VIVDTNALSGFAEGNMAVRELLAAAAGPFLPAVVLGEYRFGLLSSRERRKRLAWLEDLAQQWIVLDLTQTTARHYAEIRQELKHKATPIPSNVTWIAALAIEQRLPLLSNDPHFDLVPGVERITFAVDE
jgi:tRNA(fMet)-specific endonuclease VapC